MDASLREWLVLWTAWQEVTSYVSTSHPATADPQSVYGAALGVDRDRLSALLYGHMVGSTFEDAERILDEVLAMAMDGRRPRSATELGITREMFGGAL